MKRVLPRIVRKGNCCGLIWKDTHLYFFRPSNDHGAYSAWGFHHRVRLEKKRWRHIILRLGARGKSHRPGMRGSWTYELQSYETTRAATELAGGNTRLTYKRFIRFKIGLGGQVP